MPCRSCAGAACLYAACMLQGVPLLGVTVLSLLWCYLYALRACPCSLASADLLVVRCLVCKTAAGPVRQVPEESAADVAGIP